MKIKCSLEEFVERARELHESRFHTDSKKESQKVSSGGIKRTRLMVRVRPKDTKKTFVLKVTDGQTTLTTRVEHYGQLPLVERVINEFVTACTAAAPPR